MIKDKIVLDVKGFKIFSVIPSKFGNGAHVLISKEFSNKKIKVIVGKSVQIKENKIKLNFFGNEIFERKPSKFGTGFHIVVPKENVGKRIKLIMGVKNE
jgi:putative transposon-encoded protein